MGIADEKLVEGREIFSCRSVLWCLVFTGFAVQGILEANLNLTIIAMVRPPPTAASVTVQCAHDVPIGSNLSNLTYNAEAVKNYTKQNLAQSSVSTSEFTAKYENPTPETPEQYNDRLSWNEYEQGLALGGFYWIHWATQLPGGFLARRYGTKFIVGWSILLTALVGFLQPSCARYHLYAFVAVRVIQGFCTGFVWPSMHNLTAKWIPLVDRSKFISSYLGNSVGAAIAFPTIVMLINWFGWPAVSYVASAFGVTWSFAWYYFVHDTPQEHPKISKAEKTYILENLGESVDHSSPKAVPWKAILTSGPLWMTAIAACGNGWGILTILSEAPTYFHNIHGWEIGTSSVLFAACYVIRMIFSYTFSSFADWILRTRKLSTTNMRKLALFLSNGIQGFMLMGLALSGCHPNVALVLVMVVIAVSGAISAGSLAICIDLSPNYASILLGICNMFSVATGGLAPLLVGILTNNNQTIGQWRLVFLITAAINCLTGIPFMLFGTSELQSWNDEEVKEDYSHELQKLRQKRDDVEHDKEAAHAITEYKTETVLE